jgi:hypothetical protein
MSDASLESQLEELRQTVAIDEENLQELIKSSDKAVKTLFSEVGWLKTQVQVLQEELASLKKDRR